MKAMARQAEALRWLKAHASPATLASMQGFGIPAGNALGVTMADMLKLSKQLGPDHALAASLWDTGVHEARMVASMVDDPAQVTVAQMDRWCRQFDNWGICDTVCFKLFDRTPHAWSRVAQWTGKRQEFVKRGGFALLWGLTVHDPVAGDEKFLDGLARVELAAKDERHFVKKAVNMALRAIGKRNIPLHRAALATARRLAASDDSTARWIGADAARELVSASVAARLARKR